MTTFATPKSNFAEQEASQRCQLSQSSFLANKEQEAKLLQDKDIQESIGKLRSAVKAENYANGTKLLLHLEEKHNILFADVFFAQEEMKGYAKSSEYQRYLEKRPQARP